MPCSVQSPPSYAFSSSSDRCLPGSLFCALGVRLNICLCPEANRSESLLLKSPSYFFATLIFFPRCLFAPGQMSLCDCLGESCAQTPVLRVLLLLPVIQKDAEGVKLRCMWCWVRARWEQFLIPKKTSQNCFNWILKRKIEEECQKVRFSKWNTGWWVILRGINWKINF